MKCKECEKYWKIADPQNGVCSLPQSYFPVNADDECHYKNNKPLTCKDCDRFDTDAACMTVSENDPVNDCPGFIDINQAAIEQAMLNMFARGRYSREVMMDLIESFEGSEEYKFLTEKH